MNSIPNLQAALLELQTRINHYSENPTAPIFAKFQEEANGYQEWVRTKEERQLLSLIQNHLAELQCVAQTMQLSLEEAEEKKIDPARVQHRNRLPAKKEVELREASQYNRDEAPPACSFHAACGIQAISAKFDDVFNWIQQGDSRRLSEFQNGVIDSGLTYYAIAKEDNSSLNEGADFKNLKPNLVFIGVQKLDLVKRDLCALEADVKRIADHLHQENTAWVWIKNGNEESFALITSQERTIFFDSHKNTIVATVGKEQTTQTLAQKLGKHKMIIDGVNVLPPEIAMGNA